jgi:CPA1 family monovalent cation:H+ antiporter
MEFALVGVVAIVTIVAVATFSKQLGVAAPLVLVVVGIGLSYLPGLGNRIEVPSWVILTVVLPPLLYANAVQVPLLDFRRNFRTISVLSVWLVIATTVVVGFTLFALIPELNLGAAFALGAVVSPTDAVAATAVAKSMGLPTRIISILEGESLVNDASSLVLLKTAIATTGVAVNLWAVAGDFAFSVVIAIALGLAVGFVTVRIRARLNDSVLETASSFAIPFLAYLPVESLGASGVLAAVVAGLYSGHEGARHFTAQARISERLNWRTVQFVLENGVFLLMGFQLKTIVEEVPHESFGVLGAVGLGLLVCLLLLVVRGLFVVPLTWRARADQKRADQYAPVLAERLEDLRSRPEPEDERVAGKVERYTRKIERREADLTELAQTRVGPRSAAVITWAGMRGVVTVAAAQSLPADTPDRAQLVLIAFTVAIVTLLGQGGTLPWIIRLTKIRGSDASADRRELADLLEEMTNSALEVLNRPSDGAADDRTFDEEVIERVRRDTLNRLEGARERVDRGEDADDQLGPHSQYWILRSQVLAAERSALLEARSRGNYSSRVLGRAESLLDADETRIARGSDDF